MLRPTLKNVLGRSFLIEWVKSLGMSDFNAVVAGKAQIIPSYEFVSVPVGPEVVHRIRVTGPIDLARRLPLYDATLAVNPSSRYFCVLDNRGGFENNLTYADIKRLDEKLVEAGIACFYGATVTVDRGYQQIVDIANVNIGVAGLRGELLSTSDMETAEQFIADKLRQSIYEDS